MSIAIRQLAKRFKEVFGLPPHWAARAPGRVNLIGEHLDYNGGLVLPVAIERDIAMVAALAPDGKFRLRSETYEQDYTWPMDLLPENRSELLWPNYFVAVLDQLLHRSINVTPLWVAIDGDIPPGAGLSSSAAFEVCATRLLLQVQDQDMPGLEVARLAQAAEHSQWVGVNCGIMDQFISANAVEGHALRIDCRTLNSTLVPLDSSKASILIIHSTVERDLVRSAYNERRAECERALQQLNQASGKTHGFLTEYQPQDLDMWGGSLDDVERKRASHVVHEQLRVIECQRALGEASFSEVGQLFNQSHASLRDDYEVSCPELDSIHESAAGVEGVFGCRMTGAGFGGCAVTLVAPSRAEDAAAEIAETFERRWGKRPWTLITPACGGGDSWEH